MSYPLNLDDPRKHVDSDGSWKPLTPAQMQAQNQQRRKEVIDKLVLEFKNAVLQAMWNYEANYDPARGMELDLTPFWQDNWQKMKSWSISWDDFAGPLDDLSKVGWHVVETVPTAFAEVVCDAKMVLLLRDAAIPQVDLPLL